MSDNSHTTGHDTGHFNPSTKLVLSVMFAIAVLACLVGYMTTDSRPAVVSAKSEKATAARIQKVGAVAFQSANREMKTGDQVYGAQCAACHATGAAGSPKFGDAGAWGSRVQTGFAALLNSALKGKGAMSAQSGGAFSDFEIARAVVHMANASGGKFPEPKKPAEPDAAK